MSANAEGFCWQSYNSIRGADSSSLSVRLSQSRWTCIVIVILHLRHKPTNEGTNWQPEIRKNEQRDNRQTPGIEFGAFEPLNVTSGGNNVSGFPHKQLTKFRVFIDWSRILIPPPLIFFKGSCFDPHRMDALTDTTDKWTETCFFVRFFLSFVRLLDGVWHLKIRFDR